MAGELVGGRRRAEAGERRRVAEHRLDDGLAGAVPEEVACLGPDQGARARTVVPGGEHEALQAAQHRERPSRELALGQLGGARDLVGDRGRGDGQGVAVRVDPPAVVVEDDEAGGPDGDVGLALAPGPAGGVGDDDGDVGAGPLQQGGPERAGGGVGVDGQEHDVARRHVGRVDRPPRPW